MNCTISGLNATVFGKNTTLVCENQQTCNWSNFKTCLLRIFIQVFLKHLFLALSFERQIGMSYLGWPQSQSELIDFCPKATKSYCLRNRLRSFIANVKMSLRNTGGQSWNW